MSSVETVSVCHAPELILTAALETAGCVKVYRSLRAPLSFSRPQLAKALAALDEGDVLLVTRLDRLARPTRDLLHR